MARSGALLTRSVEPLPAFSRVDVDGPRVVVLAMVATYLAFAATWGFWYDEVRTALDLRLPYAEMLTVRWRAGHTPVYFSLLWVWARLVGFSEIALRLPSVVMAAGSVTLLASICRRIGVSAGLGALLLAANAIQLYLGTVARPYVLVELLALVAIWLVLDGEGAAPRAPGWMLGVVVALGALTHSSFLFVVAALFAYLAWRRNWSALGIAAAGMSTWLLWLAGLAAARSSVQAPVGWLGRLHPLSAPRMAADLSLGWAEFDFPRLVWAALFAPLVLALVLGARRVIRRGGLLPILAWAVPIALATLVSVFLGKSLLGMPRYFAPSLAVQALLLAAALGGIRAAALRRAAAAALVGALLVGFVMLFVKRPHPDERAKAAVLARRVGADERILALGIAGSGATFYDPRAVWLPRPFTGIFEDRPLDELIGSAPGVWLVTQESGPDQALTRTTLTLLRKDWIEVSREELDGRMVVHLHRREMWPDGAASRR